MKKIFFAILLLIGLVVKGQPIPAMIQDGRAYTDSTIITNGSRTISAIKVNTLYKKIFNILDSMLKDSTFAGAGLEIDSVFKFGRWQKRLNVNIASNYSDGVSNVDTLFLTDTILNVGNINYIKNGTPRFIESGQQFTINTVPAGYKKKCLLYINSSNVLALNPGAQDTAIAVPPSVPPGGIAIGYIDVSGNVITTPTAALSSNFWAVGTGNNVIGKQAKLGTTNDSNLVIVTANQPRLIVNGITGNVSIGTTATTSYKLNVPFPSLINSMFFDNPDPGTSRIGAPGTFKLQGNAPNSVQVLVENDIGNTFGGSGSSVFGIRAYKNGQAGVANTSLLKMWGNNGVEKFRFDTDGKMFGYAIASGAGNKTIRYDTATGAFTYYDIPSGGGASGWGLTGNSGTDSSLNFIGTADARKLNFRTNGLNRLTISNIGNVGIGTTSPSSILHIKSFNPDILLEGTSTGQSGVINFYDQNLTNRLLFIQGDIGASQIVSRSPLAIGTNTNHDLYFKTNGNVLGGFDKNGTMAIGDGFGDSFIPDPSAKLHVSGGIITDSFRLGNTWYFDKTITLTPSQIYTGNSVPILAIDTPEAGKTIAIVSAHCYLKFNTTPYDVGIAPVLTNLINSSDLYICNAISTTSIFSNGGQFIPNGSLYEVGRDPIYIVLSADNSNGDSPIIFSFTYKKITL